MEHRCANCGQPALTTDNVCWHCGEPLPWYDEEATEEVRVKEGWGPRASTSSVIFYAGITVVVVLALIFVMSSLANQPQVQVTIGTRPVEGWELITDVDQSLTTHLPQDWTWFDSADSEQSSQILELLAGSEAYLSGTNPLGGAVDDLEVVILALGSTLNLDVASPFLIVSRSEKLNRLSYDDAAVFLDEGDFNISELRFIDNFERSHLKIVVEPNTDDSSDRLRCRQQFIRGEEESLLLSLCAPVIFYATQQAIFEEIANNFQRLS